MSGQFELMREKRFLPFFVTQFLGALNDNVFKTALITMVVFHTATLTSHEGVIFATLLLPKLSPFLFCLSSYSRRLPDKLRISLRSLKSFV